MSSDTGTGSILVRDTSCSAGRNNHEDSGFQYSCEVTVEIEAGNGAEALEKAAKVSSQVEAAAASGEFEVQVRDKGGFGDTLQDLETGTTEVTLETVSPTAAPTGPACQDHSQCDGEGKCKGQHNRDKRCRERKRDCKMRGTKRNARWGCATGMQCRAGGTRKWGTCQPQ